MPFYSVVGGRPVCQQETWPVHEDVHQPQNLDTQVMQATAEKWPPPPAPRGRQQICGLATRLPVGPLFLTKQTHFAARQKSPSFLARLTFTR